MKYHYLILLFKVGFIFIIAGFLSSCEDNDAPKPDWQLVSSVLPNIGTNATRFQPDVMITDKDSNAVAAGFQYRCDFDNDGQPETDWLDTIPKTSTFSSFGRHTLKIHVKDDNGAIDSTTVDIHIQELIQITPTNISGHFQANIDWSKDGTNRIAFDMRGDDQGSIRSIFIFDYPDGSFYQVSFNPDTVGYYGDEYPEWSPDGNKIASHSNDGLDIIDLDSGQRTKLRSLAVIPMISWSPNGQWLFYWIGPGNTVIHDFTTSTTEVFSDDFDLIAWSPDGSKIATCKKNDWYNTTLKIIEFSSRNILQEFTIPKHGYKLDWSPDGRWISLGFDGMKETGYILDIETGLVFSWIPGQLVAGSYPSWSEDGSMLAFEAREEIEGMNPGLSIWAIKFPEELE